MKPRRYVLLISPLLSFTSALPLSIFRTAGSLRIDAAQLPWHCSRVANPPTPSSASPAVSLAIPINTTSLALYWNNQTELNVCFSSAEEAVLRDTSGSTLQACLFSDSSEHGSPEILETYNCDRPLYTYKDGPRFRTWNVSQCIDFACESYPQLPRNGILSRRTDNDDDDDDNTNANTGNDTRNFGHKMDLVIGLVSTLIVVVIGVSVISACYQLRPRRRKNTLISERAFLEHGDSAHLKSSDADTTLLVTPPREKQKASLLPKYGYIQDHLSKFSGMTTSSTSTGNFKTYYLGTSQKEQVAPSSASFLTTTSTVVAQSAPPSSPIPEVPKIPHSALIRIRKEENDHRWKTLPEMPLSPQLHALNKPSQESEPSFQEQRGNSFIRPKTSGSESSTNSMGQRSTYSRSRAIARGRPLHPPPSQPLPNPMPMIYNPGVRISSMQTRSVSSTSPIYDRKRTPPSAPGESASSQTLNLLDTPRQIRRDSAGPSVTSPDSSFRDRHDSLFIPKTESPQDYSFTSPENRRDTYINRRSGRDMRRPHISLKIPMEPMPIDWLSKGSLSLISEATESDKSYNERKIPVVAPLQPKKRSMVKSGVVPLAQNTMSSVIGSLPSTIGQSQSVKNIKPSSSPIPTHNPPEYSAAVQPDTPGRTSHSRRPLPSIPRVNTIS